MAGNQTVGPLYPLLTQDELDSVKSGKRLEAIKKYRTRTGLPLKAAADAVNTLWPPENVVIHDPLQEMMTDRDFWQALALYLADCQAATMLGEASLKSCSKSSRARHRSICATVVDVIEKNKLPARFLSRHLSTSSSVLHRLKEAIKE